MRTLQSPAPAASPAARLVRLSGVALTLALLAIALLAPARAPARGTIAHRGSCLSAAKHAKHAARAGHCTKHASHRGKPVTHQPAQHSHPVKKGTHQSPMPAPTPPLCEDASSAVRTSTGFVCRDGSEPGCDEGSEPVTATDGVIEGCKSTESSTEMPAEACTTEGGGCQAGEWSCEASLDANEAPMACEPTGGGEASS